MAPANNPNIHNPTVDVFVKKVQFLNDLETNTSSTKHSIGKIENAPVLDNPNPTGVVRRTHVSRYEVENIDSNTTHERFVEYTERHHGVRCPVFFVEHESNQKDSANDEHCDDRI